MPTLFKPKRSNTVDAVPQVADLAEGEIAINAKDGKMWIRDDADNIVEVSGGNNHSHPDYEQTLTEIQQDIVTIENNVAVGGRTFQYWRLVNATANPSPDNIGSLDTDNYVALDEIELIVADGSSYSAVQTQTILTSTPQDSGNQPSVVLNDGLVNPVITHCSWDKATVEDPSFFIQWDFGVGNEKAIVGLRQYMANPDTPFNGSFGSFEIQASDDGAEWIRTFYISSAYEAATNKTPQLTGNSWSDYYFLTEVGVATGTGISTDGNVQRIEIVATLPVTPDPETLYFVTT